MSHARIEFDLAEGALIAGHVLLQGIAVQRLGLLRAQVDALKVAHIRLGLGPAVAGVPKTRKKSQTFTRTWTLLAYHGNRRVGQLNCWLSRIRHYDLEE